MLVLKFARAFKELPNGMQITNRFGLNASDANSIVQVLERIIRTWKYNISFKNRKASITPVHTGLHLLLDRNYSTGNFLGSCDWFCPYSSYQFPVLGSCGFRPTRSFCPLHILGFVETTLLQLRSFLSKTQ
jgi:hypothetical protein